ALLGTLQAIWQAVGAAGGALALAFIVLLALGLLALTALFGGAAVVVLERFARQQRRWSSTLAAWAVGALAAAWIGLDAFLPGIWERPSQLARTAPLALAAAAATVGLAMAIVRLLLAIARPRTLGALALLAGALGLLAVLPVPPVTWLGFAARQDAATAGLVLLGALGGLVLLGLAPLGAAGLADTRGRVEWFVAVRYLVAKRRQ